MIFITGTIKVESADELARVRESLIRRAERSRQDEGNIDYVFSSSLEDPLEIRLFEAWESEQALNAHLQAPDEEFSNLIATAKLQSAVVTFNEITAQREMLRR
jgi:quinol monooxygenase YgiN